MSAPARGGPRTALVAVARWVRPRRWRLVGVALGLLAYAFLWIIEAHGNPSTHTQLLGVLVTIPALAVLVAGGNLLSGWMGVRHRAPQFGPPHDEGHGGVDTGE